ncbi:phosphoribosylglycinamide formyltransferase [Echria macrotheca]|uniref:Phosphoribosylglycinamide formyltransferase n=1 Tax=Echria macrotheca TaxID=438768 RepID=A0AAJ0BEF3_9PEZI|nr:phosphoribosylglycinamide formyltransferase [Echria macrotheca]
MAEAKSSEQCRVLVMASGNGSNFQALIDAVANGQIPNSRIVQLVVNRGKAYAIKRAEQAGIPWEYFNLISNGFQDKSEKDPAKLQQARDRYDAALAQKILESDARPDLIVLAGWMYIFGEHFLDPISARGIRVINLHPALPGKYDGVNAIERAYEDFQAGKLEGNKTGIMVHYVIKQVDRGETIMTREIEIRQGESLDELKERIHANEHQLIVEATAHVVGEIQTTKAKATS